MQDKKTIFLTGATGLIGSYLSKVFIENGHNIYVLARKKNEIAASDRIKKMLSFWQTNYSEKSDQKLKIIEGDLLDTDTIKKILDALPNEVIEIYHCAAITDSNYDSEMIKKVNILGFEKILKLSKALSQKRQLKKLNYISTAYVCGDYKKKYDENMLDVGQSFSTQYALSKFEAEKLIWQFRARSKFWIDIFRSPLVVGTSKEGKINEFKNIYQLIHLCSLEIFDSMPFYGINISLIPVDYLAKMIYFIANFSKTPNCCFHVFMKKSFTITEVIDVASRIFCFKKPKMSKMNKKYFSSLTPIATRIINSIPFLLDTNAKFSCFSTYALLSKHGFHFENLNKNFIKKQFLYYKAHNEFN